MTGYIYGADGTRVSVGTIATWGSCDPSVNGYQATKDSILGPNGGQLTETGVDANGNVAWAHTNVWVGGAASATNSTIGVGAGGSGGVGFILGIAASAGVQVVADSSGNLGVAINLGGNPGYGVFGAGAIGGGQVSISTASNTYALRGGSYDFGASGGAGPAYGVDVSGGDGGFTGTVTVGAGVGGKGSALTGVYTFVPSALSTNCR